jgi:deoxyribodipyrimidine photo-lyase
MEVLMKILIYFQIDTIAYNIDYTPFAKKRDNILNDFCFKNKINIIKEEDYTLFPMNYILTDSDTPYLIFTPFYKKFLTMVKDIENPFLIKNINNYIYTDLSKIKHMFVKDINYNITDDNILSFNEIKGGRENALKIFNKIKQGHFNKYPIFNKTTKLSAYMKFGCISVRECFEIIKNKYGKMHDLTRQLIWKEFFANIIFNNPRMLEGKAFKDKYDKIKWENLYIEEWKNGKTGFPIVDAAMRQLKKDGFIDNRLRMIIASFAVKDLHIDWRICEKYYATQAIDYDPTNNSCGWQGTANVGTDTTPYFRVINPWIQSIKFDIDAKYIKTWLPELNNIDAKHIHEWYNYYNIYNIYYKPIIDHKKEIKKLTKIYNVM